MVRTQDEAQALATKVMREHAAALAAREPEIDQTVVGNMGSFYRVRVGPFASAQETPSRLRQAEGHAASIAWCANSAAAFRKRHIIPRH